MNASNAAQFLPIIQALADGKTIEVCEDGVWTTRPELAYNLDPSQYRIKPEPQKLWVNLYPDGRRDAFLTEDKARQHCGRVHSRIAVPFIEVL